MEIQVSKLRTALDLLELAVPKAKQVGKLPVLANIRLGDGKVAAQNLELAVIVDLPEANEKTLLPFKMAKDFLDHVPGNEVAKITTEEGKVLIVVDVNQVSYNVPADKDWPPIPTLKVEGEGVVPGEPLVKALYETSMYAKGDDVTPVLTGVCLTPGDEVDVAAADGFRLAWETVHAKLAGDKPLIIPATTTWALQTLWKKASVPSMQGITDLSSLARAQRPLRLQWSTGLLQVHFGAVTLITQLIQGTFPNYRNLIPADGATTFTVWPADLERALQTVWGVAKDSSGIVRLAWEGDTLTVSAHASDVGETSAKIPATCSGPGRIALNISYLMSYVKGKTGQITVSATKESAPMKVAHRGVYHVVLMPMFVQYSDGPKKPVVPAPVTSVDSSAPKSPSTTPTYDEVLEEMTRNGPGEDSGEEVDELLGVPGEEPGVEPVETGKRKKGRKKKESVVAQ